MFVFLLCSLVLPLVLRGDRGMSARRTHVCAVSSICTHTHNAYMRTQLQWTAQSEDFIFFACWHLIYIYMYIQVDGLRSIYEWSLVQLESKKKCVFCVAVAVCGFLHWNWTTVEILAGNYWLSAGIWKKYTVCARHNRKLSITKSWLIAIATAQEAALFRCN